MNNRISIKNSTPPWNSNSNIIQKQIKHNNNPQKTELQLESKKHYYNIQFIIKIQKSIK